MYLSALFNSDLIIRFFDRDHTIRLENIDKTSIPLTTAVKLRYSFRVYC